MAEDHQLSEVYVKKLYAGLFLASSSLPLGFIVGSLAFQYLPGATLPETIHVAVKVTASLLGLGLFVFMSGLVTKAEATKPATNDDAWGKDR